MQKLFWPVALVLAALVLSGHFVTSCYDQKVAAWQAQADSAKAAAVVAFNANAVAQAKAKLAEGKAQAALQVVAHRDSTLQALQDQIAQTQVPDTCKPIVALKDSVISTLQSDKVDLATALHGQVETSASLAAALAKSDSALHVSQHVIEKAPVGRPFILRLLPHLGVQATAGIGPKGPDVVVGVGLGWDL
jgi:hypothetical protein